MNVNTSNQNSHNYQDHGHKALRALTAVGCVAVTVAARDPAFAALSSLSLFVVGAAAVLATWAQKDPIANTKEKIVDTKAQEIIGNKKIEQKSIISSPAVIQKEIKKETENKSPQVITNNLSSEKKIETPVFVRISPPKIKVELDLKTVAELVLKIGDSIQNGNNVVDASRIFYNELSKIMDTLSDEQKVSVCSKLIVDTEAFASCFKEIVVSKNMTLNQEVKLFISDKKIAYLKTKLFGLDLQEFLIKNAPLENLSALNQFMNLINKSKLLNNQARMDIKSSLLIVLTKFLIEKNKVSSEQPNSFNELKEYIQFIENEALYGAEITSSAIIDNTLAVGYDDDEDSDLEIDFSKKGTTLSVDEEIHLSRMDDLNKLAALSCIKEFKKILNISQFIEMLTETESFLGDIDEDHPLFTQFYLQSAKVIETYKMYQGISDITQLKKKLKPVYDQLFTKFGHGELELENAIENDTVMVNEIAEEENGLAQQNLVQSYLLLGLSEDEAYEMASIDLAAQMV